MLAPLKGKNPEQHGRPAEPPILGSLYRDLIAKRCRERGLDAIITARAYDQPSDVFAARKYTEEFNIALAKGWVITMFVTQTRAEWLRPDDQKGWGTQHEYEIFLNTPAKSVPTSAELQKRPLVEGVSKNRNGSYRTLKEILNLVRDELRSEKAAARQRHSR